MPDDKPEDDADPVVDLHVNRDFEDYKLVEKAYREGKRVNVSDMSREEMLKFFKGVARS